MTSGISQYPEAVYLPNYLLEEGYYKSILYLENVFNVTNDCTSF
jgi:hypothetical protein